MSISEPECECGVGRPNLVCPIEQHREWAETLWRTTDVINDLKEALLDGYWDTPDNRREHLAEAVSMAAIALCKVATLYTVVSGLPMSDDALRSLVGCARVTEEVSKAVLE